MAALAYNIVNNLRVLVLESSMGKTKFSCSHEHHSVNETVGNIDQGVYTDYKRTAEPKEQKYTANDKLFDSHVKLGKTRVRSSSHVVILPCRTEFRN